MVFYLMCPNGSAMASRAGKETFRFRLVYVAKAFCFVIIFFFLIAKSKRFGGLSKHAQAIKFSTLRPICYSHC